MKAGAREAGARWRSRDRENPILSVGLTFYRGPAYGRSDPGAESMAEAFVPRAKLESFVVDVLRQVGVPKADAAIVADVLITGDLRGKGSHGVARLPRYVNGIREGTIEPTDKSRVVRETATTALVDGGNSLGQVVGVKAMRLAIEKAKRSNIGLVAVRNSNHYGIAGYYALMALDHNMIGISMTNTFPLVVPTFGRAAIIGTNPIALAAPTDRETPFALDMATSVVPRGKLEAYDREGKPLPLGWAVDAEGRGTTNARTVLDNMANRRGGGVLPLGGEGEEFSGHKGYGLALMVDVLCGTLSGAASGPDAYAKQTEANLGHLFAAISIESFRPAAEFRADLDRLLRALKESPRAAGHDRIYTHGEKAAAATRAATAKGILLGPKVVENLKALGSSVSVPWASR